MEETLQKELKTLMPDELEFVRAKVKIQNRGSDFSIKNNRNGSIAFKGVLSWDEKGTELRQRVMIIVSTEKPDFNVPSLMKPKESESGDFFKDFIAGLPKGKKAMERQWTEFSHFDETRIEILKDEICDYFNDEELRAGHKKNGIGVFFQSSKVGKIYVKPN